MESFVSDLQEKWRTDGASILDRLAISEPAKLVEAISRLAARDVAVTLQERDSLGVDPALWRGFQRVCTENSIRVDDMTESPKLAE